MNEFSDLPKEILNVLYDKDNMEVLNFLVRKWRDEQWGQEEFLCTDSMIVSKTYLDNEAVTRAKRAIEASGIFFVCLKKFNHTNRRATHYRFNEPLYDDLVRRQEKKNAREESERKAKENPNYNVVNFMEFRRSKQAK